MSAGRRHAGVRARHQVTAARRGSVDVADARAVAAPRVTRVPEVRPIPWAGAAAGVLAAFAFAFGLRLVFLDRSYDVFIDEITYFLISRDLAQGKGVTLHGSPFFLHPPLFFFLQAGWLAVAQPSGPLLEQVLSVRPMQAFLAALTACTILLLAWRVAGWRTGVVAFLLFAVDPFTIKINSRNLLETTAILFVLLGYLALLWQPVAGGISRRRAVLTGVAFGGALLTKEMTFFLTLVPMGLLFLHGHVLARRTVITIVLAQAAVYACYPVAVLVAGLGPEFATEKLSGLLRFLGVMKTTGFVHGNGPSFLGAVLRNLDVFATTYALIGLGIPSALLLAWKGDPRRRVVGALGVSAYGLLAYSIALGTLEEQFFYFLVLPAMVSVPVAWSLAASTLRPWDLDGLRLPTGRVLDAGRPFAWLVRAGRVVLPVALVVSVGWSAFVWTQVRLAPDDGYRQVYGWLHRHVPQGAALGVTTDPQEFVLQGYVINPVTSPSQIRSTKSGYVVISTKQIADGYTRNGEAILTWLRANGRPVFVVDGRTYGRLEIYEVVAPG
jgi:4-amino-4-deoxy-L-arabinose transferase-like glycosyltransferase